MVSAGEVPVSEGQQEGDDGVTIPDADASEADADPDRPSDSSRPSKKRRSGIQLNKDGHPEGCDSDGGELNDEGGKRSEPFEKAGEDVLKKRKIVKASGKWSSGGKNGGAVGGGAFASVEIAPSAAGGGPLFGSGAKVPSFGSSANNASGFGGAGAASPGGFGSGFGAVSGGFGALKSSTAGDKDGTSNGDGKPTALGGGFGAASSGFGSFKSSTAFAFGGGFGSASGTGAAASSPSTFATSPKAASNASPPKFPTSAVVDTANGEQDEDCLCQVRAKLFKMAPDDDAAEGGGEGDARRGAAPSVPSTSGRMDLVKARKDGDASSPEKDQKKPTAGDEGSREEGGKERRTALKEAGIGPVRVLRRKPTIALGGSKDKEERATSARVVQRQEMSGGQGARVILNVRLDPETCVVLRRGDKLIQLNSPNGDDGSPEVERSLFRVKTAADADTLEGILKKMLEA